MDDFAESILIFSSCYIALHSRDNSDSVQGRSFQAGLDSEILSEFFLDGEKYPNQDSVSWKEINDANARINANYQLSLFNGNDESIR